MQLNREKSMSYIPLRALLARITQLSGREWGVPRKPDTSRDNRLECSADWRGVIKEQWLPGKLNYVALAALRFSLHYLLLKKFRGCLESKRTVARQFRVFSWLVFEFQMNC